MPSFGFAACPPSIGAQIDAILTGLRLELAGALVGVYLHGSLAMGCCNPLRSDLDVLVVSTEPMSVPTRRALVDLFLSHSLQPLPVEVSVVTWGQIWPWRYPTPYDLHYSELWRAPYAADLASGAWRGWQPPTWGDADLAAHVTVARARGVCLLGMPIDDALPPVPAEHYRASLAEDIGGSLEMIEQNPVYAILNCCRTYAYLQEGKILSKDEGGVWAMGALPSYRTLIESALAAYRSSGGGGLVDGDLARFVMDIRRIFAPLLDAFLI